MLITRLILRNWRNFLNVDVPLGERAFIVGPNASGKSNFLDTFRFLRDIARPGGGLQRAVRERGGLSKIRCLSARKDPSVQVEIEISTHAGERPIWRYGLGVRQESRGLRRTLVDFERVSNQDSTILDRPDPEDRKDLERLTQTHLEQINSNQAFRPIARFLEEVLYLHLVPQLVRNPEAFAGPGIPPGDPFGRSFLERVASTPKVTRKSRLAHIERVLQIAVPQLTGLSEVKDKSGIPHLEVLYEHWRPQAGKQREDQFSDGTLRLIGLLWALLENDKLLLLEEPELSLNAGIVRRLPPLMFRLQKLRSKQILISTHSYDLLTDKGIGAEEVLLLTPGAEGTEINIASSVDEMRDLLEAGSSIADAIQPRMTPKNVRQLELFP